MTQYGKSEMKEYIVNNKTVKVNVFESVRDVNDAYFLGYLFGDGGYHQPTHKRNHRIYVSSTDVGIIDDFVEYYQPLTNPVLREANSNLERGIIGRKSYKSFVLSSKFSDSLVKYGVMCVKKDRIFQNIPKKYFRAFLLGLFDADGCVTWGRRKDRNRLWANFLITHASLEMLVKVQRWLVEDFGISTFVSPKGNDEKCFVLKTSDRNSVSKLYTELYSELPFTYSKIKHKHYTDFVNEFSVCHLNGLK